MWCQSVRATYLMSSPSQSTWYTKILIFLLWYIGQDRMANFYQILSGEELFFIIFSLSQTNTLLNTAKLNYHKSEKKCLKAKDNKIQTWVSFL